MWPSRTRGWWALGVPPGSFDGLDAFRQRMAARASRLGDVGANAPEQWQPGLRGPHMPVTLSAWEREMLDGLRAELDEQLEDPGTGVALTHAQMADTLTDAQEHFGFVDGFSQPAITGADTGPRDGEGTLRRW